MPAPTRIPGEAGVLSWWVTPQTVSRLPKVSVAPKVTTSTPDSPAVVRVRRSEETQGWGCGTSVCRRRLVWRWQVTPLKREVEVILCAGLAGLWCWLLVPH